MTSNYSSPQRLGTVDSSAPEGDYSWSCGAGALIDGPVGLTAGLSLWGKDGSKNRLLNWTGTDGTRNAYLKRRFEER